MPILQKRSFFIPELLELFQSINHLQNVLFPDTRDCVTNQSITSKKDHFSSPNFPSFFRNVLSSDTLTLVIALSINQSVNQSITHAITTGRGSCRSCVIITSKKDHFSSPNFRLFPLAFLASHSKRRYNHVHMHE